MRPLFRWTRLEINSNCTSSINEYERQSRTNLSCMYTSLCFWRLFFWLLRVKNGRHPKRSKKGARQIDSRNPIYRILSWNSGLSTDDGLESLDTTKLDRRLLDGLRRYELELDTARRELTRSNQKKSAEKVCLVKVHRSQAKELVKQPLMMIWPIRVPIVPWNVECLSGRHGVCWFQRIYRDSSILLFTSPPFGGPQTKQRSLRVEEQEHQRSEISIWDMPEQSQVLYMRTRGLLD